MVCLGLASLRALLLIEHLCVSCNGCLALIVLCDKNTELVLNSERVSYLADHFLFIQAFYMILFDSES
jgi:hypothetical protein